MSVEYLESRDTGTFESLVGDFTRRKRDSNPFIFSLNTLVMFVILKINTVIVTFYVLYIAYKRACITRQFYIL